MKKWGTCESCGLYRELAFVVAPDPNNEDEESSFRGWLCEECNEGLLEGG